MFVRVVLAIKRNKSNKYFNKLKNPHVINYNKRSRNLKKYCG